ncbi:MAG TPA: ATP-binding protein, partial [Chryseosolibacter sp.]|nr:ATP-binding protein [Chryseosolibacter sp.]
GLYVTIEDISQRKLYEEKLTNAINHLQSTFDAVPALIALLDPVKQEGQPEDFVISSANDALAKFSNIGVADLIGKTIREVYPEVDGGELMKKYADVLSSGTPLSIDYYYQEKKRWFSIVVNRQANTQGLILVAIDITERKKSESEQRQIEILTTLDKLKTEFFNNISHEFRTPITLLLGPVKDLLNTRSIPAIHHSKLEMVERNALRLQKLVDSLLDFARIESGRFDVVFQPTDICEFTALLASNFRSAVEKAGLEFIVKCEKTEPVYLNRPMWEKIVFNLLSNALKFTFKGKIEIVIKSNIKHVQVLVCDTGVGVSRDNYGKIFERFVRVENVTARTFEGSGIGLALVKELVEMHGGTIKVKSEVGSGSEFIVTLPKGKRHLPPKAIHELNDQIQNLTTGDSFSTEAIGWLSETPRQHPSRKPEKKSILLVDDNADLRDYINGILKFQYQVVQVSNGAKAKECLVKGFQPDLILSDIMMPEMNGYELFHFLRSSSSFSTIPFIFLTAKASEEDRVEGIERGVDSYLVKPFSAKELLATVKSRLRGSTQSTVAA